jgi:hypothetical protein
MAVAPSIFHGQLPLVLSEIPREAPLGELDSLTVELLVARPWRTTATAAGYGRNRKVAGYAAMWVSEREGEQDSAETDIVTIQCVGLIDAGEKRKRTIGAYGRVVSIGPIEKVILVTNSEETAEDPVSGEEATAKRRIPKVDEDGEVVYKLISTPSGYGDRWNINEPGVTVTDEYFVTTKPATNIIGTAQTPPNAPTPPAYLWSGYVEPMRLQHPNGWVLEDRQIETLFELGGEGLYRVTDQYAYYHAAIPD